MPDLAAIGAAAHDLESTSGDQPLDRLRATATRVIDTHVNDRGLCRQCREPFPCPDARQAEFTLGAL